MSLQDELRKLTTGGPGVTHIAREELFNEAADEIDRLAAKLSESAPIKETQWYIDYANNKDKLVTDQMKLVDAAEARVQALKASVAAAHERIAALEVALREAKELAYRPFPKPFALETYTAFYVEWCADRERIFGKSPLETSPPAPQQK